MIIFINGSMNSGKTTVSRLLQQKIANTAVIEVDELRGFISQIPLEESLPFNHKNALAVARVFVEGGLNVIIPYPLSYQTYMELAGILQQEGNQVFAFTLDPGLKLALQQRGERGISEQVRKRIRYHYDQGINNPGYGTVIDTSRLSPEQTADRIIELTKPTD